MSLKERTFASEKGAVFVQVGISIFVMMAFNVFVLDYGMMWVGRRQAQNAADAGALAGATARAYDDFDVAAIVNWRRSAERASRSSRTTSCGSRRGNTPRSCSTAQRAVTGKCVQVNVYRNGRERQHSAADALRPDLRHQRARACERQRRRSWRTAMPRTACGPSRSRTTGTRPARR